MKICNKCKLKKEYTSFNKKTSSLDGYDNVCKDCKKILNKEYYSKNIENKIQYATNYYKSNQMYDKLKEYYSNHHKQYYTNNKNKIIEYNNNYQYNLYHSSSEFKIKKALRTRFNHAIKGSKIKSILKIVGCTLEKCKQHLESQFTPEMNWDNHGKYWEIDHIIPCSSFDLTDVEQQKQCFHYTNLQPLTKKENRTKSNKML